MRETKAIEAERQEKAPKENYKRGLILEGGAMRGMFTCGVIDVLMENKIPFDGVIGVSAGAAFGCNYKSKQIGRPVRYSKTYCNDPRYVGVKSLLTTGNLYNVEFGYYVVPEQLDVFDTHTFKENPMAFHVVCTDAQTGKPVYHQCMKGDRQDIEWIRASASMPLVSKAVKLEGMDLLDGGISDSVPIRYYESQGYHKNVVVLTQPRDYRKDKMKGLGLMKVALAKYPRVLDALKVRHDVYNDTTQYVFEKEKQGDTFVIAPSEALNIGKVEKNPDELERVYQLGRQAMTAQLENLKDFLNL